MSWLDLIALTPFLILALGAAALLLISAWRPAGTPLVVGGIVIALAAALVAGLLPSPVVEISGLFDGGPYGRFFTILWSLTAAMVLMISHRYILERNFAAGEYVALILYAATGMGLLSAATSLIGLFLGLESFTLALYILIAFQRHSEPAAEAGLKYLVLGATATGFMTFGIGLIYTASGSFHFPEAFAAMASAGHLRPWGMLGWVMLLIAIGFKVSLVPFHFWTPDVYQGASAPVSGLLATGSKGAVMAALIGALAGGTGLLQELESLLWVLAVVTMLVGAISALPQTNLKRLLAYSSVVHMGTLLIGLICQSANGLSAAIYYLVVYSIASLGTFAVIANLSDNSHEIQQIDRLRGLGYVHPFRCGILAVLLLSLAGMPPTAGFMAKFAIFHAAIDAGYTSLALIGILASLISFHFYLRVIIALFMVDDQAPACHPGTSLEQSVLLVCLSGILVLGLFPDLLFNLIGLILP
jgi:NADH-quinone oxidoreductase subunit N